MNYVMYATTCMHECKQFLLLSFFSIRKVSKLKLCFVFNARGPLQPDGCKLYVILTFAYVKEN